MARERPLVRKPWRAGRGQADSGAMNRARQCLPASLLALVLLAGCASREARLPVQPAAACFAVHGLTDTERALNESLLLKALDSEALYTLLSDLKPVSSGFERREIVLAAPDPAEVDRLRRVLATWQCDGDLVAGVQAFTRVYDGKRTLHAWVGRRAAVARVMGRQPRFFTALGLTPATPVGETLLTIEVADAATRFRGYGWLFGYPDAAVDFFVEAAASQERTGTLVPRDFRSMPTFSHPTSQFVWARPKGAEDSEAELAIERQAREVLERYRALRARFIGEGKAGAVALMRDALARSASPST